MYAYMDTHASCRHNPNSRFQMHNSNICWQKVVQVGVHRLTGWQTHTHKCTNAKDVCVCVCLCAWVCVFMWQVGYRQNKQGVSGVSAPSLFMAIKARDWGQGWGVVYLQAELIWEGGALKHLSPKATHLAGRADTLAFFQCYLPWFLAASLLASFSENTLKNKVEESDFRSSTLVWEGRVERGCREIIIEMEPGTSYVKDASLFGVFETFCQPSLTVGCSGSSLPSMLIF